MLLGYFSRLSHGAAGDIRLSQFRCKRPTGSRHYSHLPRIICYSIFSKVWLLALVWRRTCSLANRIPMIPVFTCLFCLFLSSFLAEIAQTELDYFIPSRVLVGLGAVCFTLFSIVSILEAGSAKKN
ncbi:DUF2776 family protein [Shigella flexneri]